jgi:hypothetical protein
MNFTAPSTYQEASATGMSAAEATRVAAVDRPRIHQRIDHELRIEIDITTSWDQAL